MTPAQREAIERHGRRLLAIFPRANIKDPLTLCRRLRRIEADASRNALRLCNGEIMQSEYSTHAGALLGEVNAILGAVEGVKLIINGDPRGYALKIDDASMRDGRLSLHTDMGGYGIIAPEIDTAGH